MNQDYVRPRDLQEALALGAEPGAVYLGGGTDLLVPGNAHRERATSLVSLRDVEELHSLRWLPDGRFFIGAMITHAALAASQEVRDHFPALAEACGSVGSLPIRTAATVGGNLCTAVPSADSACPLLLYGSEAVVADREGTRYLPLRGFFTGPKQTALEDGGLLLGLRVAPSARPASASAFRKISRRAAVDIALVSVAALVELEMGSCARLVLALGAVGPTPLLVDEADGIALGRSIDAGLLGQLADAAQEAARPISDLRASADYRRRMVAVLVRDVVSEAGRRALAPGERGLS